VHVAELLDGGPNHVSPQRGEVVTLVEDDRRNAPPTERVEPRTGAGREQVAEMELAVLGARDLALERGGDPRELTPAARRGLFRPGTRLALDLLHGRVRGGCALGRPPPPREVAEGGRGVVELRERLVGETGDRRRRVGGGKSPWRAETLHRLQPLRLDGRVRDEDERRRREAADDLDSEEGLPRARRGDDVRPPRPRAAIALERVERELLVAPPLALEGELPKLIQPASRGP
jgi:hypothetical protein